MLLGVLDHLLAYAIRANSGGGEGVIRFWGKQPFASLVLVFLLRQVLHGAENYRLEQRGIPMVMCNRRCGLTSVRELRHCILPMAIDTGASQSGQKCAFDPRKRTVRTPQPSQNLSSRAFITSEEWRDS